MAAFVLGSLMLPAGLANAQPTQPEEGYQYVVKFLCGDADQWDAEGIDIDGDSHVDAGQFIARGEYYTSINIHNPNDRYVNMFKKIALDGYRIQTGWDPHPCRECDGGLGNKEWIPVEKPRFLPQVPGPTIWINIWNGTTPPLDPDFPDDEPPWSETPKAIELSPDEAFQINCEEIRHVVNEYTNGDFWYVLNPDGTKGEKCSLDNDDPDCIKPLIKGYFVIFSEARLDVTAIYTACDEGETEALDCSKEYVRDGTGGWGVSSIDIEEIQENPVPPPSDLVPPRPTTAGLSLSAAGQGVRFDLLVSRFSALSEARLMVYDLRGSLLHDSGFVPGTSLSWRPMAAQRPLANGVYLYVIAAKDVFGRVGYRVGKFALLR